VVIIVGIVIVTATAIAIVLALGRNNAPLEAANNTITVDCITPEIGSVFITGTYIGTMEPVQQIMVYPKLPGEVQSVYFSVGDTVKAGDILFTINATDIINGIKSLEAQLEVQEAMVKAAETGISLAGGSAMQGQILSASGGVLQAQAAIEQAEQNMQQALIASQQAQLAYDTIAKNYEDTATLFELGIVAKIELEQLETALANAQLTLDRAKSGHDMAEIALSQAKQAHEQARDGKRIVEGAPGENLRRAQDGLNQAIAARNIIIVNLETTRERLDDAAVKAPIDGVVESRNIEPLNMAAPQAPAFIISNKDSMLVVFNVPSGIASNLKTGDAATVEVGGTTYPGALTEVGVRVNVFGLFPVKAQIGGDLSAVKTGMTATVTLNTSYTEGAVTLPLKHVFFRDNEAYVYAMEDSAVVVKPIVTGLVSDDMVEILSGVDLDTQIISTWSPDLKHGAQVIVNR